MSSEQSVEYSPADENYYSLMRLLFDKKWGDAFEIINKHEEVATMVQDSLDGTGVPLRIILGSTALHLACRFGAPFRIIDLLIQLNPHAIKAKDDFGELPLHHLFLGPADPAVVQRMIEADPSAAKVQNEYGALALDIALRNKEIPVESFEILLAAYPEGAHATVLHRACMRLLERDNLCQILTLLMKANPDAVSTANSGGQYPFHRMIEAMVGQPTLAINPESMKAFKMVMDSTANIASTPCPFFNGGLPLHYFLLNNPPSTENCYHLWSEMITTLFKTYPGAVNFADNKGQRPLHVACRKLSPDCRDVLALLVNANPEVLDVEDNEGKTPLNYACGRRDAEEFGPVLFSVTPNGVLLNKLKRINAANEELVVAFAGAMVRNDTLENLSQCKKRRFSF